MQECLVDKTICQASQAAILTAVTLGLVLSALWLRRPDELSPRPRTHTHGAETEVQKALPPMMGDEKLLSRERDFTFANYPIHYLSFRIITPLQELTSYA